MKIKRLDKPSYLAIVPLLVFSFIFANKTQFVSSSYYNDAYHHKHILGPNGNYTLEWTVHWESKSIVFNVSAECKGYIGLGLSKTGSISGSDFVIGGIDSSGKSYLSVSSKVNQRALNQSFDILYLLVETNRTCMEFQMEHYERIIDTIGPCSMSIVEMDGFI